MRRIAPTILLAALLLPSGGCLITDPILPFEDGPNQPPQFAPGRPQPDPSSTLDYPSTSQANIVFDATALDPENGVLNYYWHLDGLPVQSGNDATEYGTTPATLGPGQHLLDVTITDEGVPQGFISATWHVNVQ